MDAILARTRVIALVGASPNPSRASHRVGDFLAGRGYRVIPVNPGQAGRTLFGETARADLSALAAEGIRVDMVDIFRQSAHAGAVVDEAIAALGPLGLATIWMQLGVVDDDAAARARAAGLDVVMDRCPKIELERPG
ncbi:MAG: CoA-binding protein [Pseudomonadota bacterium]